MTNSHNPQHPVKLTVTTRTELGHLAADTTVDARYAPRGPIVFGGGIPRVDKKGKRTPAEGLVLVTDGRAAAVVRATVERTDNAEPYTSLAPAAVKTKRKRFIITGKRVERGDVNVVNTTIAAEPNKPDIETVESRDILKLADFTSPFRAAARYSDFRFVCINTKSLLAIAKTLNEDIDSVLIGVGTPDRPMPVIGQHGIGLIQPVTPAAIDGDLATYSQADKADKHIDPKATTNALRMNVWCLQQFSRHADQFVETFEEANKAKVIDGLPKLRPMRLPAPEVKEWHKNIPDLPPAPPAPTQPTQPATMSPAPPTTPTARPVVTIVAPPRTRSASVGVSPIASRNSPAPVSPDTSDLDLD